MSVGHDQPVSGQDDARAKVGRSAQIRTQFYDAGYHHCGDVLDRAEAGRPDVAGGPVVTAFRFHRCETESAVTPPTPADTAATASPAAKSGTPRERLCGSWSADVAPSAPSRA